MSSRRLARRDAISPVLGSQDPNRVTHKTFEHPIFGHVRMTFRGGELHRIKWSSPDFGQNVFSRNGYPQRFAEILEKLGIDDFGKHNDKRKQGK